ncbi:ImmA/IrrE family metallo-endopeptidase [Verrucomicrobium sp. BvORR034]|uniref:ImmA/IrrE family metallo-endopeptidase n=1 Tax=Verrucomicrobium sp. BvORR034 TaxID=1396418 RepID=UPI0006784EC2|nr:ImmA/IrrE family metallo-endopeptidase [Verrucomicrobium sp. BvORR034]
MPAADISDFESPVASGLSKVAVLKLAADVSARLGYEPGQDLEPLVRRLGGIIRYQSWLEATDGGSLEVFPHHVGTEQDPKFVIRISPNVGNLRNRFTVAHELGHYFLHAGVGAKAIRVNRDGSDRVEWEANWFAAGFLMPEERFRRDWQETGGSIPLMVGRYQVSEPVIEIQKANLGLP